MAYLTGMVGLVGGKEEARQCCIVIASEEGSKY